MAGGGRVKRAYPQGDAPSRMISEDIAKWLAGAQCVRANGPLLVVLVDPLDLRAAPSRALQRRRLDADPGGRARAKLRDSDGHDGVHGKNGWLFSNTGGGWEYPAFWTAALLALFLLGDGVAVLLASPPLGHLV